MTWPRETPDLPAHREVRSAIDQRLSRLLTSGDGGLLVLTGDLGTGRTSHLRAAARRAREQSPGHDLVARRFSDGLVEVWKPLQGLEVSDALQAAGTVAGLAAKGTMVMGQPQVATALRGAAGAASSTGRAVSWLQDRLRPEFASVLTADRLLELCDGQKEQPLLVLLDDLDLAPGGTHWWRELVEPVARRADSGLPILVVAAVRDSLGEPSRTIDSLVDRGLAEVCPVPPIGVPDIETLLPHSVSRELASSLVDLGSGNLSLIRRQWTDWVGHGTVVLDGSRRYRFADSVGEADLTGVRDRSLDRALRGLVADEAARTDARRWLAVGALEGRTFTAAAVAAVTGVTTDDVVDLFDDHLCATGALLEEAPPARVGNDEDHLTLWRYRFRSAGTWVALTHLGLSRQERAELAEPLADTLLELFGEEPGQVTGTVSRLLRDVDPDRSAALAESSRDWVLSNAVLAQAARAATWARERGTPEDARWACDVLDWAVDRLIRRGALEVAFDLVVAQVELSVLTGSSWYQGCACLRTGTAVARSGNAELAVELFETGLEHSERTPDKGLLGSLLIELAEAYYVADRPDDAVATARRAIGIAADLDATTASCGLYLALGDRYLADPEESLVALHEAWRLGQRARKGWRLSLTATRLCQQSIAAGHKDEVASSLRKLVALDPDDYDDLTPDQHLDHVVKGFVSCVRDLAPAELAAAGVSVLEALSRYLPRDDVTAKSLHDAGHAVWLCVYSATILRERRVPRSGFSWLHNTPASDDPARLREEDLGIPLMRALTERTGPTAEP